jgi:hypothetical protein
MISSRCRALLLKNAIAGCRWMSSTFDEHPLTRATRFARSPGVGVALALLSSAASAAPTTLDAFTSVENCSPWVVDLGDALGSHGTTTGLSLALFARSIVHQV